MANTGAEYYCFSPLITGRVLLDLAHVVGVDMDASPPLSIPRLRLPRYSPQYKDQALTPIAGPSHNPDFLRTDDDGDDDAESTPRMVASVISDKQSPRTITSPGLPADNPTARLRALLARIPHSPDGATPHASSSRQFALPSTSEPESDFEPPQAFATTSSMARESLRSFSRMRCGILGIPRERLGGHGGIALMPARSR